MFIAQRRYDLHYCVLDSDHIYEGLRRDQVPSQTYVNEPEYLEPVELRQIYHRPSPMSRTDEINKTQPRHGPSHVVGKLDLTQMAYLPLLSQSFNAQFWRTHELRCDESPLLFFRSTLIMRWMTENTKTWVKLLINHNLLLISISFGKLPFVD